MKRRTVNPLPAGHERAHALKPGQAFEVDGYRYTVSRVVRFGRSSCRVYTVEGRTEFMEAAFVFRRLTAIRVVDGDS